MVEYPVEAPYRELLLTLEFLMFFVFLEIATYFSYRYWQNKQKNNPSVIELDWALLFGSFGIAYVFYIIGDFYAPYFGFERVFLVVLAYLVLGLGVFLFVFHLELSRTIFTGYKITLVISSLFVIFIGLYFFAPSILQTVGSMISFLGFAIVLIYFLTIIKRIWKFYKGYSIGLFMGIFLWLLGYTGTSDIAITLFGGFYIRVIGDIAILGGMSLVALFVNLIPSLAEIGWRDKIKYVILMTKGGLGLYSEKFQEAEQVSDVLLAGSIFGIDSFFNNVLKDAQLEIIERGKDVILIEKGELVTGVLIVEQNLRIFRYLLKKLVIQFEFFYSRLLMKWRGDTSFFKPTHHLIRNIFALDK